MKKKHHLKIKHAVVLVNYKVASETINCINSINKCTDIPHIIVVDNGSTSEVIAELRAAFPDLDLIVAGKNIGFSAGNNLGIKKALRLGAEVVHILNNDTEVDPNLFKYAYRFVAHKDRIGAGKIYYAKGYEFHEKQKGQGNILWYAGGFFDWKSVIAKHYGVDEVDHGQYDTVAPVEFVTGCYMAIPRQVFKKIGLLDEPFFLYLEDSEYCLKALRSGIDILYNPKCVIYHRNSSSTVAGSPLVDYYITRNRLFLGFRYGTIRLKAALLKEALTRNFSSRVRRAAFFDFLFNHMGNQNAKIQTLSAHHA